ncbi:uncharacterized protein BDZ99DRAFT_541471 [Mytilinidion resinicola]|uniref:Uncharacterized protein n=1 Tax=Mytilinidion resinicola TaxID=574789 RepID=A0A6A6Z600_9PEZI|nr:uncharacterized protein BDZ99DRAFT_541471 [Mytilinidion resinicola]KAF2815687.1 hypothetical protein BDZ99DRAFT_541471 [Mytilinidion resinicola]
MPHPSSFPTYPPSSYVLVPFLLAFFLVLYQALPQLTAQRYSRGKHQPPPPPRPRGRPPPRPTPLPPPPPSDLNRTRPHLPALHTANLPRLEDYAPAPIPTFFPGFRVNEAMRKARHLHAIEAAWARAFREMRGHIQTLRDQVQDHWEQSQGLQEQVWRHGDIEVMSSSTSTQTLDFDLPNMSGAGEVPRSDDAYFECNNVYDGSGSEESTRPEWHWGGRRSNVYGDGAYAVGHSPRARHLFALQSAAAAAQARRRHESRSGNGRALESEWVL